LEYGPTLPILADETVENEVATKADKSANTQRRIIDVAREVFARDGFAAAGLSEIVSKANVTTGAVYHHFGDKKGLFIAVAEHLEQVILDEVSASMSPSDAPWDSFEAGAIGALEICARPDIQRIVFRDAPAVVGLAEWREIEIKYAFGLMGQTISLLSGAGLLDTENSDLTAQILLGAIIEAAHAVALSDDPDAALSQSKTTIRKLLQAFKI